MREKFEKLTSTCIPLPIENVDTDQIIPARFLKDTSKIGYKKYLFHDWRFDADGKPKAEFVLNNPTYTGEILLAGKNFGSGSSREHAAWAIADYGFRGTYLNFPAENPSILILLLTSCSSASLASCLRCVEICPWPPYPAFLSLSPFCISSSR